MNRSILNSPLFSGIRPEELEGMLQCLSARKQSFKKGEFLLHAGDSVNFIGLVLKGSVQVVKEDFWGNRTIIGSFGESGLFAEAFACAETEVLPVSVIALSPAKILFLDYYKILSICSSACSFHTKLVRNMLGILAHKNLYLTKKMDHMSKKTTRQKLLSYLSEQASLRKKTSFDIPLNRQQLADYLAVDRSAMSSELGKMRDEGLIQFSKNHFVLNNEFSFIQ